MKESMGIVGQQQKTIIAMKGLPFTGKTSTAILLASWLEVPIFHLDDMLAVYSPHVPSSKQNSDYIHDLAFNVVCRIAMSQLKSIKKRKCVIIDSPLSPSHLDCLIGRAKSLAAAEAFEVKILIVECQRRNKYAWEMSFEQPVDWIMTRRVHHREKYWFKVQSWADVEKSIENYDASLDNKYGDISGIKISKLVLDPTTEINASAVRSSQDARVPRLIEAVNYLMIQVDQTDDDTPIVMDLAQWRNVQWRNVHLLDQSSDNIVPCDLNHYWTEYNLPDGGDDHKSLLCLACVDHVTTTSQLYTYKHCNILLHKSCAELPEKKIFHTFSRIEYGYTVPQRHLCDSCKTQGCQDFSSTCNSCNFVTHLRSRVTPTIVHHYGHQHFLSVHLDLEGEIPFDYICDACGSSISSPTYYSCMICDMHYHFECVFLPLNSRHDHQGYRDHMTLKVSSDEELEDYLCNICENKRNPKHWFYYCEDCDYAAHVKCVQYDFVGDDEDNGGYITLGLDNEPDVLRWGLRVRG